jgi:hypothetical protein
VGRYQGTVKDDPQHAACTVSIQSNGQVTVGIDGKTLTHQVPPKPEDANANGFKTSFGFYASHTRAFYELRSEGPNASGVTQKFDITLQQSSAQDSVPAYHAEATISGSTHACTADIALPPVNAAQFNACPKTQITDLTLEKYSNQLHCLSGVYRGTLLNAQGAPTAEACDIMLQPRGWVSLFTDHAETSSTFELVAMDDYFEVDAAYDGRPNGNTVSSLFTHHLNGMDTRFNAVLTQTPSGLALESHLMRNDGAYTVDGKNTDLSCRSAVIK